MPSINLPGLSKPRILVFADWFEPGYKAGGPIRSCLHFVQQMKDAYECYVFTSDRDLHATSAYAGIEQNRWIEFSPGIQVFYCSPEQLSWKNILQQVKKTAPQFIYLNSMFSRYFAIYPLLMLKRGLIDAKAILAPRGMLRESALQFKSSKKKIFLSFFRVLGIHRLVHFHATDNTEQTDIYKQFGPGVAVTMAPNFGGFVKNYPGSVPKQPQQLSVVFIGRIHPIKNLHYLLQLLPRVAGNISLTVVGSEEDKQYATQCKALVQNFPPHISVRFTGEMPNNRLPEILHQHHIFALPTQGENFGHAIYEALSAGRPALISDQTPWQGLQAKKAGWVIALQQQEVFVQALQQALDFDQQQYDEWSYAAWQHAAQLAAQQDVKQLYYNLFR